MRFLCRARPNLDHSESKVGQVVAKHQSKFGEIIAKHNPKLWFSGRLKAKSEKTSESRMFEVLVYHHNSEFTPKELAQRRGETNILHSKEITEKAVPARYWRMKYSLADQGLHSYVMMSFVFKGLIRVPQIPTNVREVQTPGSEGRNCIFYLYWIHDANAEFYFQGWPLKDQHINNVDGTVTSVYKFDTQVGNFIPILLVLFDPDQTHKFNLQWSWTPKQSHDGGSQVANLVYHPTSAYELLLPLPEEATLHTLAKVPTYANEALYVIRTPLDIANLKVSPDKDKNKHVYRGYYYADQSIGRLTFSSPHRSTLRLYTHQKETDDATQSLVYKALVFESEGNVPCETFLQLLAFRYYFVEIETEAPNGVPEFEAMLQTTPDPTHLTNLELNLIELGR